MNDDRSKYVAAEAARVLDVIRGTTRSWEQSPGPFASLDEEDLRSVLVGSLNGAFLGRATAESFNGRGKTDIMVRSGSDNVLLGECKLYNGPNGIVNAVDQLLGYATWRDQALCLLVFVRSAAISTAVRALRTACCRSAHVDQLELLDESGAEVLFHGRAPDDPDRPVTIRAFLIHIKLPRPSRPAKGARRHRTPPKALHPEDLAEVLLDLKQAIPRNAGVDYTPVLDPGPDVPVRGWGVRWSRVTEEGVAGIQALPVDDGAMREHAPEGVLTAPDDATVRRLHHAVRRAHRDLVRIDLSGLAVRFDRIVGALRDAADRVERTDPKHITVTYGPRGLWQCSVSVEHGHESLTVPMAFRVIDPPRNSWDLTLRGTVFDLALTISASRGRREVQLVWDLQARQGPAAERLAALRFLVALLRGGVIKLTSIDPGFGDLEYPLEPEAPDGIPDWLRWELRVWQNVALLEERLGVELPPPPDEKYDQEWVSAVFSAANTLRTGKARIDVEPGSFRLHRRAPMPKLGETITVPAALDVSIEIAGTSVNLGVGAGSLAVRVTNVRTESGVTHVGYEPATNEPLEVELVRGPVEHEGTESVGAVPNGA